MVGWIFENLLHDVICYRIGFIFLKAITFGKYPDSTQRSPKKESIKLTGVIILILCLTVIGWSVIKIAGTGV